MRVAICLENLHRGGGTLIALGHATDLAASGRHEVVLVCDRLEGDLLDGIDPTITLISRSEAAAAAPMDLVMFTYWQTGFWCTQVPARAYGQFLQSLEDRFAPLQTPRAREAAATVQLAGWPTVTEACWLQDWLALLAPDQPCFLARNGIDKVTFPPTPPPVIRPSGPLRVVVEGSMAWFKHTREALLGALAATAPIELTYVAPTSDWFDDLDFSGLVSHRRIGGLTQEEFAGVMRANDVMVRMASVEGMPGPPLEAMHCGMTVITTPVRGIEEYAVHGDNCLQVAFGDHQACGRWLDVLWSDPALLHRLRAGAHRTATAWPSRQDSSLVFEMALEAIADLGYRPDSVRDRRTGPIVGVSHVLTPDGGHVGHDHEAALPAACAPAAPGDTDPGPGASSRIPQLLSAGRRLSSRSALRFDPDFYVSQFVPERRPARPAWHYRTKGIRQQRAPHPAFDPHWYCGGTRTLPDPLVDYALRGPGNLRSPTPLFDVPWYRAQMLAAGLTAPGHVFDHYLAVGFELGLTPHPYIDPGWYLDTYPDVTQEPLTHYLRTGFAEGRIMSGWLDPQYIKATYGVQGDPQATLRFVMSDLVPHRRPTRAGQAPVRDIVAGRRLALKCGILLP